MSKFNGANSDPLKYLSPSLADKCWRELVNSSFRSHPFASWNHPVTPGRIPSSRHTMYKSTYSFPKDVLLDRARSASRIPPADELVDLAKNAEYQALLADHMRKRIESGDASARTGSSRSLSSGVALSTRSSDHHARGVPLSNRSRRL